MKSVHNLWLIGPRMDTAFFIATPLAIIPAYHLLSALVSLSVLKFAVLSLSATGHHLPGFIRAYTDPVVFRQYRARLVLVPALIVLLAAVAAWYKLTLLFFLLIVWGTWHGIMQIHGFLRIYDAKAGIHSRAMARLDLWVCLTWFVQVILWSSGKKMSILGTFYMSGGPLFPTGAAKAFETGWLILTVAVTAAYAVATIRAARRGDLNPRKLATLSVSLAFWAYCMITIDNLIVGLLLWEIFHDLQYNAFVWSYNRSRVARGLSRSRVENFLFRADWRRIALYAGCIVAYGSIGFLSQDLLGLYQNRETYGSALSRIGNVFACSALIHFYMDGFIWKVRDAKVREDLGMTAAPGPALAGGGPGNARHWIFVGALFAGSLALGSSERLHWTSRQQDGQAASLVDLVPGNGYAHFMRAVELEGRGLADSARTHYRRAIALDTNYDFLHKRVGDLSLHLGDTTGALAAYERARSLDPLDPEANERLAGLYTTTGRAARAEPAFRVLLRLDSSRAEIHYGLAFSLLQQRRGLDARPHLERSLELDSAQPAALNYLGMVEHALGNPDKARALYEAALRRDPGYEHAQRNLAALGNEGGEGSAGRPRPGAPR